MQNGMTHAMKTASSAGGGARAGLFATFVQGVMAGAIGTWAMDRVDWFMWDHESAAARQRTRDVRPNKEPPAHVLASKAEKLLDLEPSQERHAATGQAIHFCIGVLPAIAYALVRDKLPGRGVGRGLIFGGGAFAVQDELMNTMSGLGAKPRDYPWQAHVRGLVAHLIYGVVTELTLDAMEKSARRLASDYTRKPAKGAG